MKNTYGKRKSSISNNSFTRQKETFTKLKEKMKNYKVRLSVSDGFEIQQGGQMLNTKILETNIKKRDTDMYKCMNNKITEERAKINNVGSIIAQNKNTDSKITCIDDMYHIKSVTSDANKTAKNIDFEEKDYTIDTDKLVASFDEYSKNQYDMDYIEILEQNEDTLNLFKNDFNIPGIKFTNNEPSLYDEIYNAVDLETQKNKETIAKGIIDMKHVMQDCNETVFHLSECDQIFSGPIKPHIDTESIYSLSIKDIDNSLYYDYESDISFDYTSSRKVKEIKLESVPNNTFFEKYLKLPTKPFKSLQCKNVKKINEATFSDVYLLKDKIYKIINFNDMTEDEFYKEAFISKVLSKEKGIIKYIDCFFVEGCYPRSFIRAWNDFENKYNKKPKQGINKHGVIVMEHGGFDLESFIFENEDEVEYFLHEIVFILENLEKKFEFEHRDLHWGNILIRRTRRVNDSCNFCKCKTNKTHSNEKYKLSDTDCYANKEINQELSKKNKKHNEINKENDKLIANAQRNNLQIDLAKFKNSKEIKSLVHSDKLIKRKRGRPRLSNDIVNDKKTMKKIKKYEFGRKSNGYDLISKNKSNVENKNSYCTCDIKQQSLPGCNDDKLRSHIKGNTITKKVNNYKPFEINIIDFTLSRIKFNNKVIYTDLSQKTWLFEGNESEDLQYGIYKRMKRDEYFTFDETSNLLWFEYIVKKVMSKCPSYGVYEYLLTQIEHCNCIHEIAKKIRLRQKDANK